VGLEVRFDASKCVVFFSAASRSALVLERYMADRTLGYGQRLAGGNLESGKGLGKTLPRQPSAKEVHYTARLELLDDKTNR
jgi:hypothetical protein